MRDIVADLYISPDKLLILTQTKFLSNIANKEKFVDLLSNYLKNCNINCSVSEEDAGLLIVRTAIELKQKNL